MIITIIRKPFEGSLIENTRAKNCGGINIDRSRIALSAGEDCSRKLTKKEGCKGSGGWKNASEFTGSINDDWKKGRWPANFFLSEALQDVLNTQSGIIKSPKTYTRNADGFNNGVFSDKKIIGEKAGTLSINFGDVGGASKFFRVIK